MGAPPSLSLVAKALLQAWGVRHQGTAPPALGIAIALSVGIGAEGAWAAWSEGGETLYPFEGTNNFGAIHAARAFAKNHATDAGYGMVAFLDHAPGAYITRMAVYPSLLAGAEAYLAIVENYVQLAAVSSTSDYAAQLYTHNYFEGFHPARTPVPQRAAALASGSWTPDDLANIADYAGLLGRGLHAAQTALAAAETEAGDPSAMSHGPPFAPLPLRLTPAASLAPHTLAHARDLLGPAATDPPAGAISLADALAAPTQDGVWMFPQGAIVPVPVASPKPRGGPVPLAGVLVLSALALAAAAALGVAAGSLAAGGRLAV